MPKIGCNYGAVQALRHRELLLVKSTYRANLKTLKSIIVSDQTKYSEVWKTTKPNNIIYSDGRLFMEQYKKCFVLCGRNSLPSLAYELHSPNNSGKIEDTVFCCSSVKHFCVENSRSYKNFMLTLTSTNWLCSYSIETGNLLERVYLGSKSRYNYKHLDWERQGETVTVTSVKNPLKGATQSTDVLAVIAWFSVRPLQFKALLEFDKKVFGKDCAHCNVSEGLLIVGSGNSSTGNVLLYDFYETVREGILFSCDLGQTCNELDGAVVGSYPAGIPLNCKVKEPPPVLFQVQCSEYTLHFGCFPFHCVFSVPKYPETFQISDVSQQKMVKNGKISIANSSFDKCHISFHGDDSGRIIHYSNTAVRFFKLIEDANGMKQLQECFKIDLREQVNIPDRCKPVSNRPVRQATKKPSLDYISDCDRTFLCDDYENEIDIYAVLFVSPSFGAQTLTVDLYDNTDRKVKEINMGVKYDEFSEYDLTLDLDLILIIEKTSHHKYACFMYQIQERQAKENYRKCHKRKNKR